MNRSVTSPARCRKLHRERACPVHSSARTANDRRFFGFISYEFNRRLPWRVAGLLGLWLGLELREGWRTWFSRAKVGAAASAPAPLATPPIAQQT